jgi:hypothetical protein
MPDARAIALQCPLPTSAQVQERKLYDERFVRTLETKKLCEVTVAADALEMRQLVDMTSRALARLIGRYVGHQEHSCSICDVFSMQGHRCWAPIGRR